MKRTIKFKNVICLISVLIFLVSITATPVYAIDIPNAIRQRFAAGIASALLALNVTLESTLAPYQQMLDYVAEPLNTAIEYTYPQTDWEDEILDRSVIQIWDEYVEIDGQKYTDIWLSHDAAEKFRVNAFDFKTAYNLTSNSTATFASGDGYFDGSPYFNVNGVIKTQNYDLGGLGTYQIGDSLAEKYMDGNKVRTRLTLSDGTTNSWQYNPDYVYKRASQTTGGVPTKFRYYTSSSSTTSSSIEGNISLIDYEPFDFNWVSGTIPADQTLPQDHGLMIRVPSEDVEPFLVDHPSFQNNNPVEMDFDIHPELKIDADDLFDVLAPILADLDFGDIQFIENHESPAPVINNLLPDTYKQEILQPITENFQQTQNTINQMGDTIVENIPKIDEICNNIDTAPYHDLNTGLDHLPTVFLPFITDLRSALGIWHYVTEWITQISNTFAFMTACLAGTAIMTPIYAGIAGYLCIKVYRRMTG